MNQLRRLRGLFGLAIAWGIAWIPMGLVLALIDGRARGRTVNLGYLIAGIPTFVSVGAFCGFAFGLVFAVIERKRTFGSLSWPRFIGWGIGAAAIVPAVAVLANPFGFSLTGAATSIGVFGLLGGISAAGTLAIARRAPDELEAAHAPARVSPSK